MASDDGLLLIDDDEESREAMSAAVSLAGISVATATDGQHAIDLLESGRLRPSVILCDLVMPVVDGWEFCRWKAAQPELQQIPVILMSAHEPPARMVGRGLANAYLAKPVDPMALVSAVMAYRRRSFS